MTEDEDIALAKKRIEAVRDEIKDKIEKLQEKLAEQVGILEGVEMALVIFERKKERTMTLPTIEETISVFIDQIKDPDCTGWTCPNCAWELNYKVYGYECAQCGQDWAQEAGEAMEKIYEVTAVVTTTETITYPFLAESESDAEKAMKEKLSVRFRDQEIVAVAEIKDAGI